MTEAASLGEADWSDVCRTDTRHQPVSLPEEPPRLRAPKTPIGRATATATTSRPRTAATRPAVGLRTSRAPRVPFAVLVISLLVGGIALLLVLNTASAANELDRQNLADADATAAAQVQQLQNEVASSAAPANLARAAQGLGMTPAGSPAFLVVAPDGSVTVRGSASPVAPAPVAIPPALKSKAKTPKAKTAKTKTTKTAKAKAKTAKSKTATSKTKAKTDKTATSKTTKSKTDKTAKSTSKSGTSKATQTRKHSHGGHP